MVDRGSGDCVRRWLKGKSEPTRLCEATLTPILASTNITTPRRATSILPCRWRRWHTDQDVEETQVGGDEGRLYLGSPIRGADMSNNEDPVERFVAFVEGQAQRFVDPDRRRLDDAVMRVHDWLTGSQLDPHDQTVVRTFHSVMQLLADQAGRQVATRHLPPNDALLRAAAELWEAAQDMWETQQIVGGAEAMTSGER